MKNNRRVVVSINSAAPKSFLIFSRSDVYVISDKKNLHPRAHHGNEGSFATLMGRTPFGIPFWDSATSICRLTSYAERISFTLNNLQIYVRSGFLLQPLPAAGPHMPVPDRALHPKSHGTRCTPAIWRHCRRLYFGQRESECSSVYAPDQ